MAGSPRRRRKLWRHPVLLAGAVAFALGGSFWWSLTPTGAAERTVKIPRGSGASQIARQLADEGLIRSPYPFLLYCTLTRRSNRLRPGAYKLSGSLSTMAIADRIARTGGSSEDVTVTLPEGLTAQQTADRLAQAGAIDSAAEFLDIVQHPGGNVELPFPPPPTGLEGYLFPNTYRFRRHSHPAEVIERLCRTFYERFALTNEAVLDRSGRSLHEVVTIGSLIEREAERSSELARVSGVIVNRLNRHMLLQIDATVLYALGHHKDRVLKADLEVQSPYNTYRNPGLPPGPIASPGLPSLVAALFPERHEFLYYVVNPDGGHTFSRTEAEHNKAVRRYRAWMRSEAQQP